MAGAEDAPAPCSSRVVALGGFLLDDDPTPTAPGSVARSTKEVLEKLVDGDSVPIDLLSQFEAAVPAVTPGDDVAQLCCLTEDHRQVCEKLHVSEDACNQRAET